MEGCESGGRRDRWPGSVPPGSQEAAALGAGGPGRASKGIPSTVQANNCCTVIILSHQGKAALCRQRPEGVSCTARSSQTGVHTCRCCVDGVEAGHPESWPRQTTPSQRQGPLLSLSLPSSRIKITSLFLHSRMQEMTSKARGQVEHSLFH